MSAAWPWLAALLSAGVAFLELHVQKRKPLSWRATHWILLRLAADGVAGYLAYTLLEFAFGDLDWFGNIWSALVAGLIGPALLRSQLSLIGSGDETSAGPAVVFRRLQRYADEAVDDIGANAQSKWIHSKVLPVLDRPGSLDYLVGRADDYLAQLDRFDQVVRAAKREQIQQVAVDDSTDGEKSRVIVQILLDLKCQRAVRSIVADLRKAPAAVARG